MKHEDTKNVQDKLMEAVRAVRDLTDEDITVERKELEDITRMLIRTR